METAMKQQQGFLYMDVLIAIFIVTVSLTAITGIFVYATKLNVSAGHYTAATNLAREQMELLKSWKESDWRDLSLPISIPWQGSPDNLIVNNTTFAVNTNAEQIDDTDPSLIQITVIVSWEELSGTRNVRLTTYFSKG